VRWRESVAYMASQVSHGFSKSAAGKVLSGLVKRIAGWRHWIRRRANDICLGKQALRCRATA